VPDSHALQAVIKRLMTDVPFGVLLSGGLDSSLVASVTKRHLVKTEAAEKFGTELHSFVVGLEVFFRGVFFFFALMMVTLTFFACLSPAGTYVSGLP
jgi:hypothetical protein